MRSWEKTRAALAIAVVAAAVIASAVGCGGGSPSATESAISTDQGGTASTTATSNPNTNGAFTLQELADFDGKDGMPAYVAVDGVVYDVSDSRSWTEGTHGRCNLGATAGQDLSELITQAPPNMRALLEAMPVVGNLIR